MDQLTTVAMGPSRRWLSAAAMAFAVETDPQFRLPAKPRLLPGLVVVKLPDGLVVEGTAERQVLRGAAATTLVPRVMPLLDGCHDIAGLATLLPDVRTQDLHAVLSLLYACGLLEDAAQAAPHRFDGCSDEVLGYLARNLDTTRVNRSKDEAASRLATARVALPGDGPVTQIVAELLQEVGVEVISSLDDPVPDLVLAVEGEAAWSIGAVDAWCTQRGIPWLRTAANGSTIEIGPLFDDPHTACSSCFGEATPALPTTATTPAVQAVWAGLIATEVIHVLARVGSPLSWSGCAVIDIRSWEQRLLSASRRPGCPRCNPLPDGVLVETPLAYRYEQAVAFPPPERLNPKDHQHHYRPANLVLQREAKTYTSAALTPLPLGPPPVGLAATLLRRPPVCDDRAGVPLSVLSTVLERTAGLREDASVPRHKVQRWAPTGGNLGSVQAYVLAANVQGLAAGWHFFQPRDHALARVRPLTSCDAVERASQLAAEPDVNAVLVLTGALSRVATKYRDFGYRIICLDAGAALAQLRTVARGCGAEARPISRWDDAALAQDLGTEPFYEPVTAVVALTSGVARER